MHSDRAQEGGGPVAKDQTAGDREDPGGDDPSGDAPPHRREPPRRPNAEDGARDGVRRGDRNAEARGDLDDRRRGGLGREPVDWLQRGDAHAHSPDDPPATRRRPEADRERADDLDPGVDVKLAGIAVEGIDRQRDDAHRLLSVVPPMAEGHVRARQDLSAAEETVHEAIAHIPQEPVDPEHEQVSTDEREGRGIHDPERGLLKATDDDYLGAMSRERRADHTEDQRVAGGSRQRGDERDEIPDDGANKCSDHDVLRDDLRVDDPGADGFSDGFTGECPDEVEHPSHEDRLKGRQHPSCDHRGDRIRGVVEPIYELEEDSENHHKGEENGRVVQLAVLHPNGLDDIGDVLAAVDGDLDQGVDVLPFDDLDRIVSPREELGDGFAPDLVSLVLERVDLDPVRLKVLQALEILEHEEHLARRRHKHLHLTHRGRSNVLHLEALHKLRDVVATVGDVVDLACEADDVLAIERSDEGLIEMADDLVVELVPVVLDRVDVAHLVLDLGEVAKG